MPVQRFALADARLERSPGQDADIFAANMVDGQDGSPVSVGFGRYGPDQSLTESLAVDDVMVVLEGRLSITAGARVLLCETGEGLSSDERLELANGCEVPILGLLAVARGKELPGGDRTVVAQVDGRGRIRGATPNMSGS